MTRSAITFAFLSMFIAGTAANAASYNCAKASTYVEKAICANTTVSQLDDALASAYRSAMATSSTPNELRNEQRAWLAERDRCHDIYCVHTAIEKRIAALEGNSVTELQAASQNHTLGPTPTLAPEPDPEYDPVPTPTPAHGQASQEYVPVPKPVYAPAPIHTQSATQAPAAETARKEKTYTEDEQGYVDQAAEAYSSPAPQASYTSSNPNAKPASRLPLKIGFILLVVICLTAIYLHRQGKLTIYHDYTDAAFTSLIPLTVILLQWLLSWLEMPKPYPFYISLVLGAMLSFFVIRSTYSANGFNLGFFMALIAKVTMIGVYYAIMAALLSSGTGRKKGESQAAFAARQRREGKEARALMIFITGLFTWLSAWLCRKREFSDIGDYLAGRTH